MTVRSCFANCSSNSFRFVRSWGKKPSKTKRSAGKPDALNAAATAVQFIYQLKVIKSGCTIPDGPGMGITEMLCLWASVIKGTPGSLIDGVPVWNVRLSESEKLLWIATTHQHRLPATQHDRRSEESKHNNTIVGIKKFRHPSRARLSYSHNTINLCWRGMLMIWQQLYASLVLFVIHYLIPLEHYPCRTRICTSTSESVEVVQKKYYPDNNLK